MLKAKLNDFLSLPEPIVPLSSQRQVVLAFLDKVKNLESKPQDLKKILFYSRETRQFCFLDTLIKAPAHTYVRIANPEQLAKLAQSPDPHSGIIKLIKKFAEKERVAIRKQTILSGMDHNYLDNPFCLTNFVTKQYIDSLTSKQLDQLDTDWITKYYPRINSLPDDAFYRLVEQLNRDSQLMLLECSQATPLISRTPIVADNPYDGLSARFTKKALAAFGKRIRLPLLTIEINQLSDYWRKHPYYLSQFIQPVISSQDDLQIELNHELIKLDHQWTRKGNFAPTVFDDNYVVTHGFFNKIDQHTWPQYLKDAYAETVKHLEMALADDLKNDHPLSR